MFTTISNSMNKEVDYYMEVNYVETDKAVVFSDIKENTFLKFQNAVERIDFGADKRFF